MRESIIINEEAMGDSIIINEAAAESDISNIKQAQIKLEKSLENIQKLKKISIAMTANTGIAITEQCERLENMIGDLLSNLTKSQNKIQDVVRRYKEEDRNKGREMRNLMGGC